MPNISAVDGAVPNNMGDRSLDHSVQDVDAGGTQARVQFNDIGDFNALAGPLSETKQDDAAFNPDVNNPADFGSEYTYVSPWMKGTTPAEAPTEADESFLNDFGKTLAGPAVKAVGSMVRGAGQVGTAFERIGSVIANPNADVAPEDLPSKNRLAGAADSIEGKGQSILDSRSPAAKLLQINSTPDGSLKDPSTWTFGDDPTLKGYGLQMANAVGSFLPIVLTGIAGRILGAGQVATTTVAGGLQGGGAGIEQARDTIAQLTDEDLARESKVYQQAIADGLDAKQAREKVVQAVADPAFWSTLPASTVGGALTGKIFSPGRALLSGRGVLANTGGKAALSGLEEGAQETAEGVGTNAGINTGAGMNRDTWEGSFNNAVVGALGGTAPGGVKGLVEGVRERGAVKALPQADRVLPTDIMNDGRPFISLRYAQKIAAEQGGQVHRVGNRFIVRKTTGDAGSDFVDELGLQPEAGQDTAEPAAEAAQPDVNRPGTKREEAQRRARADLDGQPSGRTSSDGAQQPTFEPGQTVFVFQNGRSIPVEFVGYESNAARANSGERLARIKTPDGRGHFVRAADLVSEQPPAPPAAQLGNRLSQSDDDAGDGGGGTPALDAPDARERVSGPPRFPALPNAENVSASGEGFVARPAFNIPPDAPRGIRNNNPGNIEKGVGFQGEVDGNDSRFATFDSPESGIRALARNLLTYQEKYGLNTVEQIVNRWAPSSENDTGAYVAGVATAMGVQPGQAINLRDPDTIERLTTAIIQHENGMQPYSAEHVRAGVVGALTGAPIPRSLPAPTVAVNSQGEAMTADQRTQSAQQARARANDLAELGLTEDVVEAGKKHPGGMESAIHEAQTSPTNDLPEPTDAQKEAGNYKKGHIAIDGLNISIENPEGSIRSGTDEDGTPWSNTLRSHYGYIRGTEARDGDHVDTFIKPGTPGDYSGKVFVVDQVNPKTRRYDEAKVMMGYDSQNEAEAAYKANYAPDWKGMGTVTAWDMPTFKRWLSEGNTKRPATEWKLPPSNPQSDTGLGSIASASVKPNGKGFMTRTEAQKAAAAIGGHVVPDGDRFVVRNEIAGSDVTPPGADRSAGPAATVITPAGRDVKVRYRVVSADDLVTSNSDTGAVNPDYPVSLQPRDRSRSASEMQIHGIAQQLRPQLLGMSATTSDGAPIISHRGVVESGNGRTLAIKRAYSQKLPSAKAYKKWLSDQGYDVSKIKNPVLVRQRDTEMSIKDLQDYTRESNERTTAEMSTPEQAKADAKAITPILGDYAGGDIGSAANRDFVRKFIRDVVAKADQGKMMGADGILSQDGKRRMQAALMSAAYDSPEIVADLFESSDNNIKDIGNALLDMAGQWAQMRAEAASGSIPADMDVTPNLIGAVNVIRHARRENKSVYDLANQSDIITGQTDPVTMEFLRAFYSGEKLTRARGRKPVTEFLSDYIRIAQSTKPGENMFGDAAPSGEQILKAVNERQRDSERTSQSQDLFASSSGDAASPGQPSGPGEGSGAAQVRGQSPQSGQRSGSAGRDELNEPSRDTQTIDMFDGQGQAQGNVGLPARAGQTVHPRRGSSTDIPSLPGLSSRARAVVSGPEINGKSAVIVERKQTGIIATGFDKITSPSEAAHALASIRKYPQENIVALITDKDGRPISILRHSIGRISSAEITPSIVAGHVARTKNAANVWLAHNHPSGVAEFSDADIRVTDVYGDLTSGGQVRLQGMFAIAGGKYAFYNPSNRTDRRENRTIPPKARKHTVPIVERVFVRAGTLEQDTVSPARAAALVKRLLDDKPGLVLFDSQNRPVATIPMSLDEMAKLKGTGGVDKVLAGIERANATNAIVYVPDGAAIYARNVATLVDKSGTRVLDIIAGTESLASQGQPLGNSSGAVESRGRPTTQRTFAAEIKAAVDEVMDKLPGASNLKIHVVSRSAQVPERHVPSINAEGVYYPSQGAGTIYLVADNLPSIQRAKQVLAHEIVGHFGMEALLGERFADVLADVQRLTAVPAGVNVADQRPGDKYYATLEAVKTDYPDYSPENQAREVLARMAETNVRPYFLERVYGYIRKFLRSLGLTDRYSAAEIKGMVVDAAKRLRESSPEQARAGVLSAAESLRRAESRRQVGRDTVPVDDATDELLREHGEIITSKMDAERRFGNGERIFGFHEQDETASELFTLESINSYAPDQLLALPAGIEPDGAATGNRDTADSAQASILESRATTAGPMPAGKPAKEPRYRGNVERPGEALSNVERNLRQRAMSKIGAFSEIEPFPERAKKLTANWQAKAIQGVFDQFAPLKNLDIKAYMQARLSKGTDGGVEALFKAGSVKLTDGALDLKEANGGMVKILADLGGEHDHWFAWIAGNRAKRLAAEGRENLFTEKDIDILTGMNRGRMADGRDRATVYADALKKFDALQKSVMDVAQQAGLIDGESRKLWEHEFYVPFYRVMEEDQTGTMGPGQINGLVGQRAFKKLKGGQERLGDLLGNTLSNWSHLLSASMKNMAAQQSLKAAADIGVAELVPASEKGSVRVMVDGKEKHYLVNDPLVLDALTSLHYVGSNTPVMKAMKRFKHFLTIGVTSSPTFRIRNLARDSLSAMASNDISYNPAKNILDGWRGTSSESPTFQRLLAGGGAVRFGSLNDGDQAYNAKRLVELGVESGNILDSQSKVKRAFQASWDWYQELGDRGETVNRAAVYEKAIKDGRSHLEASYMARDLMDFTAAGKFASIRLLTQVVPFFNARLQGIYKLGRAAKSDPQRFSAVTGAVAMASVFLYMAGKDDDDYKALPDWVRNTYWVTRMPGINKFVYIPKPFEVGALGTVVERMTELAVAGNDYQAKDFVKTMLHVMGDQLSMNPIPQLFRPIMGAAFNRDDFRDIDIDSPAQMRLPAGDRHTARTSAGAVVAGQALGISPQRLEYVTRGYFGWIGTQALNVADFAVRPLTNLPSNPSRDNTRVDNWFAAGDFVKEPDGRSSKYVQRFYDSQREVEQIYAAFSEARKLGDIERARELAEKPELQLRPLYQSVNKQMTAINRRIKQVDNDLSLDNAEKALLRDALYQKRNRLAAMADERARAR